MHRFDRSSQRGAALVVGLIFLVVTTMIAVLALGSTILQERMTSGLRNDSLAFNGADSALRRQEYLLWREHLDSSGLDVEAAPPESMSGESNEALLVKKFRSAVGWVNTGTAYTGVPSGVTSKAGTGELGEQPRVMVEHISTTCSPESHYCDANYGTGAKGAMHVFRNTARSTGADKRVIRTSESVYALGF